MKVLKDTYTTTVQCTRCHSTLRINKDDIDVDAGRNGGVCCCTFRCAACNKSSSIPNKNGEGWAYDINDIF